MSVGGLGTVQALASQCCAAGAVCIGSLSPVSPTNPVRQGARLTASSQNGCVSVQLPVFLWCIIGALVTSPQHIVRLVLILTLQFVLCSLQQGDGKPGCSITRQPHSRITDALEAAFHAWVDEQEASHKCTGQHTPQVWDPLFVYVWQCMCEGMILDRTVPAFCTGKPSMELHCATCRLQTCQHRRDRHDPHNQPPSAVQVNTCW